MRSTLPIVLAGLLISLLALGAASVQDADAAPSADAKAQSATTFWLLAWPDEIQQMDPSTDEILKRVKTRYGLPHGAQVNHDDSEMWLVTNRGSVVEVLDLEKGEIVEDHDFAEPNWIIRVETVREVPGGTHWWVNVERVERKLDHYVVHEDQWWYYDRIDGEIEKREKELPKKIRSARISEDGERWRISGSDLTYLNAETLEEEVKIELSKPRYTGMGAIRLNGDDLDRGAKWPLVRHMYSMRDPVKRDRSIAGIVEIDMEKGEVLKLTEWGAAPRVWRWRVTHDGTRAVGQSGWGGGSDTYGADPEITLVSLDLTTGKVTRRTRVTVRNGLGLTGISPDGSKIYLAGRGHDIHVYDAEHKFVKEIALDGETEGRLFVVDR